MNTLEFPSYSPEEEKKEFLQKISRLISNAQETLKGRSVFLNMEHDLKEAVRVLEEAVEQKNYKGIRQKIAFLERSLDVVKKEQKKQLELDELYGNTMDDGSPLPYWHR